MNGELSNVIDQVRKMPRTERGHLLRAFFDDPELRDDLLDLAALIEAENEPGERVELEEYIASRQTR